MSKDEKKSLSANLAKLAEIAKWFDSADDIDIEKGLEKVKEATKIIKESKERLKDIENEFTEIKKEIEPEDDLAPDF